MQEGKKKMCINLKKVLIGGIVAGAAILAISLIFSYLAGLHLKR